MAHQSNDSHSGQGKGHSHLHFILPESTAWKIFGALIVLTIITVGLSYVHLGPLNYIIGMLVATVKAGLVIGYFMTLKYDRKSNLVIFMTGFFFILVFFGLAFPDLLYRGDVMVKGPLMKEGGGPKLSKPWEPRDEVLAHAKGVYALQCASCHGPDGKGDGPAAAALNPPPRNFTADAGWKNGRKPSQIFKTLKEGIPGGGMASFSTVPATTRWALSAYVNTLGPNPPKDTPADLQAQGVDPNAEGAVGGDESKMIPISTAMKLEAKAGDSAADESAREYSDRLKAKTFTKQPISGGAN